MRSVDSAPSTLLLDMAGPRPELGFTGICRDWQQRRARRSNRGPSERCREAPDLPCHGPQSVRRKLKLQEMSMKAVISALIALSVLTGASVSALAYSGEYDYPNNVFDNIERHLP